MPFKTTVNWLFSINSSKGFIVSLNILLYKIPKEKKNVFFHGEFNVDWLKNDKHAGTNKFLDSISSYMFLQYIFHPTSTTGYSQTITDNIFSNFIFNIGNMQ